MVMTIMFGAIIVSDQSDGTGADEILEVTIDGTTTKYTDYTQANTTCNNATSVVTINILKDFTITNIGNNQGNINFYNTTSKLDITINGNNHTITSTGNVQNSIVLSCDKEESLTINNLNIVATNAKHAVSICNSTATLNNVNVSGYSGNGFSINNSTVSMMECSANSSINNWGSVNYDKGSDVKIDTIADLGKVYSDDASGESSIHFDSMPEASMIVSNNNQNMYVVYCESLDDVAREYTAMKSTLSDSDVEIGVHEKTSLNVPLNLESNTTLKMDEGTEVLVMSELTNNGTILGNVTTSGSGSFIDNGTYVPSEEPSTPSIPDDDDELPFIPPQSDDGDGADTTTYVAVAAAAAVIAILAVLAVGISKGKL